MSTATADPKLRMRTKLAFGIGGAAESAVYIAFNTFNLLFYNNVLGLPGTLSGLAVTIALVFDAISDPLVGSISDRWRSRLGRRHPFLYTSALPLGICFFCIYSPPAGLGTTGLFLWLCVFTILLRTAVTFYHVPHLALGAELTRDYRERSVVMGYNAIFQVIGGSAAAFLGWTWFGKVAGGTAERANYVPLGLTVGLLSTVLVFLSARYTRDQIPRLAKVPENMPRFTFAEFLSDISGCLRNRNYRVLLLGLLLLSGMLGVRETLLAHLYLFFWALPEQSIRFIALGSPPAYLLAFAFVPRFHARYEKRDTIMAAAVGAALAATIPVVARMLGLFPGNDSPVLLPALVVFSGLFYLSIATLTISVMSALADVADEHELEFGRRQEGIFYSARTFFQKMSQGIGHLVGGLALDLIAFPKGAKPGEIPVDSVFVLGLIDGPIAAVPGIAAIFFYARYRIDKRRHAEVQAALRARRAEAAAAAAA